MDSDCAYALLYGLLCPWRLSIWSKPLCFAKPALTIKCSSAKPFAISRSTLQKGHTVFRSHLSFPHWCYAEVVSSLLLALFFALGDWLWWYCEGWIFANSSKYWIGIRSSKSDQLQKLAFAITMGLPSHSKSLKSLPGFASAAAFQAAYIQACHSSF